ncbi:MAG: DUF4236 domain-containing protein [Chloroflexi bacterium]|nr:DUF4236 domain-containing protein [Chloroflexota bacterium]
MGWRFRRILRTGPFRASLSRSGIGWSVGIPGLRVGISATGQKYVSVGFPGLGVYWIKYFREARQTPPASPPNQPPPQIGPPPTAQIPSQQWWKDQRS